MVICKIFNIYLLKHRYYEGKEDEVKMQSYRPGKISEQLRVLISPAKIFSSLSKHLVFQNSRQLLGL